MTGPGAQGCWLVRADSRTTARLSSISSPQERPVFRDRGEANNGPRRGKSARKPLSLPGQDDSRREQCGSPARLWQERAFWAEFSAQAGRFRPRWGCLPRPPLPPVTWQVTFFDGASRIETMICARKVTCQAWQVTLAGTGGSRPRSLPTRGAPCQNGIPCQSPPKCKKCSKIVHPSDLVTSCDHVNKSLLSAAQIIEIPGLATRK